MIITEGAWYDKEYNLPVLRRPEKIYNQYYGKYTNVVYLDDAINEGFTTFDHLKLHKIIPKQRKISAYGFFLSMKILGIKNIQEYWDRKVYNKYKFLPSNPMREYGKTWKMLTKRGYKGGV